nr:hypothetical protein [Tanacetum cinerariifolium]
DVQDSPDDKEDKKRSQEYMDDLGEEYQEKSLLAKSKKFFKKGTQRPNKDFKAKYNKVKAKLALLSLSASASKASMVKKKGLIAEAYELDEEKVSSDDNEMNLADESSVCSTPLPPLEKLNGVEPVFGPKTIKSILKSKSTFKAEVLKGIIINEPSSTPAKGNKSDLASKVNSIPADESSVCSTPLPPLEKLNGVEPVFGPKTIKSILKSKSTFKAEVLKGIIINEPSSTPAKGNKSDLASKVNSIPAGKLKKVKIKDDPPLAIVMKELNNLKLQISKNQSSYSRINQPQQVT